MFRDGETSSEQIAGNKMTRILLGIWKCAFQ